MSSFKNTYSKLPHSFYETSSPASFSKPELIIFNEDLACDLDFQEVLNIPNERLAQIFSGQEILPGSEPLALAYAGYQFGHPVAVLGDGRAHYLGEIKQHDIQLKGSGQTPFSRRGDGRSALGPVLREYLISEAMHSLGVPTTRALAAVRTGEEVVRQFGAEPGGVFTRVATSHIRVGTFQYFAFKGDIDSIKTLVDYTLERHYPQILKKIGANHYKEKSLALLKSLLEVQSQLVAHWQSIGFIHGVMNTDNFSLAGITIDYGPCAFMDEFNFHQKFSSIDHQGRYSFSNQTQIAKWNILRLADCLIPLISEGKYKEKEKGEEKERAINIVEHELMSLFPLFEAKRNERFALKLGIQNYQAEDSELITTFLTYLETEKLDFTLSFRKLPELLENSKHSFYPDTPLLKEFLEQWKKRNPNSSLMEQINPLYIPRNHLIQKAIDLSYQGDDSYFHKLHQLFKNPYQEGPYSEEFCSPPTEKERVEKTYCGT